MSDENFSLLKGTVIEADLCTRCGGCVASCPVQALEYQEDGIILSGMCISCGTCYRICPGKGMDFTVHEKRLFGRSRRSSPGSIRGIYRKKENLVASDRDIIRAGYFGGRISAVLINALEEGMIDAALLTDWSTLGDLSIGEARIARDRNSVLASASSKYVFSPVLTLLRDVHEDPSIKTVAVVGLPCHIEALRNMEMDPSASRMVKKVRYMIGLNCGAPHMDREGWIRYLTVKFDVGRDEIKGFKAGKVSKDVIEMKLALTDGHVESRKVRIIEYLSNFNRNRNWPRCQICPDYSADLSDVTFGPPLIRTERGEELIESALDNGYVKKGTLSRSVVQFYTDLHVGLGKRSRMRRNMKRKERISELLPRYQ